jgi:hypothetical protein
MKSNYSVNEILNAVDSLLRSKSIKLKQETNLQEISQILSAVNKIHSNKISEKINDTNFAEKLTKSTKAPFVLNEVAKEEKLLKLNNILKTNDVLILNRLVSVQ